MLCNYLNFIPPFPHLQNDDNDEKSLLVVIHKLYSQSTMDAKMAVNQKIGPKGHGWWAPGRLPVGKSSSKWNPVREAAHFHLIYLVEATEDQNMLQFFSRCCFLSWSRGKQGPLDLSCPIELQRGSAFNRTVYFTRKKSHFLCDEGLACLCLTGAYPWPSTLSQCCKSTPRRATASALLPLKCCHQIILACPPSFA